MHFQGLRFCIALLLLGGADAANGPEDVTEAHDDHDAANLAAHDDHNVNDHNVTAVAHAEVPSGSTASPFGGLIVLGGGASSSQEEPWQAYEWPSEAHDDLHVLCMAQVFRAERMSRHIALSSLSGVSSASVVSLLSHVLSSSPQLLDPCPLCPALPDLDLGSFFFGLGCGVLLLPLLEALLLLRAACLRALAFRLQSPGFFRLALGVEPDEFELVAESAPVAGSYTATPVSTPPRASASPEYPLQGRGPAEPHLFRTEVAAPVLPRTDRDCACREIGLWIVRALAGNHRGASGRDRLSQSSRFWVVFRSFEGRDFSPPRAFSSFAQAKTLCKRGSECGASVFIGLPARADQASLLFLLSEMAEEDPLDGLPLEPKDFAILQPEGVDPDFLSGLLPFAAAEGEKQTCEVIVVCESEGKIVVAVPGVMWGRKLADRKLPRSALTKASSLEVAAVAADDRGLVVEGTSLRVWVALLENGLAGELLFESGEAPDVPFGQDMQGVTLLPHAASLMTAVQELPGLGPYASAESAAPADHEPGEGGIHARVDRLEAAMSKVAVGVKALLAKQSVPAEPSFRPPTAKPKPAKAAVSSGSQAGAFANLDVSVTQAALDAGVSRAALAEMDKLVGESGGLGRKARAAPPRKADPLSESEGEPEEPMAAVAPVKGSDPVGEALVKLTQLVETLSAPKRRAPSSLDNLLDAAGQGGSGSLEAAPSLRRNAAARRALRAALVDNPCILSATVEALMKEDLHSLQTPGFEVAPSARAWLEHRSRIGSHQTLARTSWAVAGALDAARRKAFDECEARLNVLMVAMDQVATDRGSWTLANDLLLEAPCPIHAFKAHEMRLSGKEAAPAADFSVSPVAPHSVCEGRNLPSFANPAEEKGFRRPPPPGAAAPSVKVPGFWNSLPSWILKGHGAFAAYLRTTTIAVNVSAHGSQTWPCAPPYPEVFSRRIGGVSGWRKVQTCLVIVLLSWLHLGSPCVCPERCRVGAKLSPNQWRMVRTIEGLTWDSDFSDPIVAAEMGRSASKVEDQHNLLAALSRAAASFSLPLYSRVSSAIFQESAAAGAQHSFSSPANFGKVVGAFRRDDPVAAKTIEADRLTFPGPPRFNPASFVDADTRRRLSPDECVRISCADLRDYFYLFAVTPDRVERNLLRGSLTLAEARFVFGRDCRAEAEAGRRVRVAISTLGMGDCSACEYAQASHIAVLHHYGLLEGSDLLVPNRPPPRSLLSVGIVIDDLVLFDRCLRGSGTGRPDSAGARKLDTAHAAYDAALLEANPKKSVRDAAEASFWGCKLCGDSGVLRANPARVWPVAFMTARVAALGLVTRSLLESLVGSWTAIFLIRRRALSLIDLAFQALRATRCGDVLRLSPALADELWSWVLVAPVCVANLRAQVCDAFFTTDASDDRIACATAALPPAVALEAYRHTLQKGAWNRILSAPQAWLRAKGLLDEAARVGPTLRILCGALARSLQFRTTWVIPGALGQHINIKELRGLLELERRVGRLVSCARLLVGLDSQVALGAALKGRSASAGLNTLLKRSLATMFGSDLYLGLSFLASADNPSDDGTRCRSIRTASEALPPWFLALARGDPQPLDRWLAEQPELASESAAETFRPEMVDELPKLASEATWSRPPELPERLPPRRNRAKRACGVDLSRPRGGLDLFSGSAGVARRLIARGAPWVLSFEIARSPSQDLDNHCVRQLVELLIRAKIFLTFGASPPCSSFSRAVHPPFRSAAHPRGLLHLSPTAFEKVRRGNRQADWVGHALSLYREHCQGHFWIEGPDGSFMWLLAGLIEEFADPHSPQLLRLDQCRFGTRWRKRSRFGVNGCIAGARLFCQCSGPHVVLRGRSAELGRPWTSVAQCYPRPLCDMLATAAAVAAGWWRDAPTLRGVPLSAALSKTPTARIGEASHPGPRRSNRRRDSTLDLEQRPLQSEAALRLGQLGWEHFLSWVQSFLPEPCLVVFARAPALLAMALRAYGNWLFKSGKSIHELRHTLLGAQRNFAGVKPWIGRAWELVSRWENVEPVEHRVPLPEPVLKALVAYLASGTSQGLRF
ncbi:unnamed protein product [Symbiodinium sp. CCMP2592]|nr:unnamed protein product [Symbiodinium sp. CCMP2592]